MRYLRTLDVDGFSPSVRWYRALLNYERILTSAAGNDPTENDVFDTMIEQALTSNRFLINRTTSHLIEKDGDVHDILSQMQGPRYPLTIMFNLYSTSPLGQSAMITFNMIVTDVENDQLWDDLPPIIQTAIPSWARVGDIHRTFTPR